ncbi:MAG: DUF1150 family protein [Pseudomonadota bacterium]
MTLNPSPTADPFETANLVYIRPLAEGEIETLLSPTVLEDLQASEPLFAVHNAKGDRIAIVEGRDAAFAAARANSLQPASLH